jgi:hypothetical protein
MIPWVQLDTAKTPDGDHELRLKQRGAEFSIMLGSNELMNSRLSGSEEALAKLSCQRIAGRSQPKILIVAPMPVSLSPSWCPPSWRGRAARWPRCSAVVSTIRA